MIEQLKERLAKWWFLKRELEDEMGKFFVPSRWEQFQSAMEWYRHKYILKDGRKTLKYIWTNRKHPDIIAYHSVDAEKELSDILAEQFKN